MAARSSKRRSSSGRGTRSSGSGSRGGGRSRSTGSRSSRSSSRTRSAASGRSRSTGSRSSGARAASGRSSARRRGKQAEEQEVQQARGSRGSGRSSSRRRASGAGTRSRGVQSRSRSSQGGRSSSRARSAQGGRSTQRSRSTQAGRSSGRSRSASSSRTSQSRGRSGATARRSSSRGGDVLAMLQQDHRKVEQLFQQFDKAKEPRQKQKLFQSIRSELDLHAQLEEQLFYPRAEDQGDKELKDQIEEAHGEHDKVKQLLREAEGLDPDSGEFDATVAAIKGAVEHHVEEEENEMFQKVRERMTAQDLKEMGRQLKQLRSSIRPGNGSGGSERGLVGRLMGR